MATIFEKLAENAKKMATNLKGFLSSSLVETVAGFIPGAGSVLTVARKGLDLVSPGDAKDQAKEAIATSVATIGTEPTTVKESALSLMKRYRIDTSVLVNALIGR